MSEGGYAAHQKPSFANGFKLEIHFASFRPDGSLLEKLRRLSSSMPKLNPALPFTNTKTSIEEEYIMQSFETN